MLSCFELINSVFVRLVSEPTNCRVIVKDD